MMAESIEDIFKKELVEKYTKNKKYLILRDEYYKLITTSWKSKLLLPCSGLLKNCFKE